MKIPSELIPHCPRCKKAMKMNLELIRALHKIRGGNEVKERYDPFIQEYGNAEILLELGVGHNTLVWIRYPFWKLTERNQKAFYVYINQEEAYVPPQIKERSLLLE